MSSAEASRTDEGFEDSNGISDCDSSCRIFVLEVYVLNKQKIRICGECHREKFLVREWR